VRVFRERKKWKKGYFRERNDVEREREGFWRCG